MNKIIIPDVADCWADNHGNVLSFHVGIEDEKAFEVFCQTNNIGYHEGARRDVVKSDLHIFTSNKDVFENYPDKVEMMS